jgi:hypothetical protein
MKIYPYKGKIDTVGALNVTIHDEMSQTELNVFLGDFDKILMKFEDIELITNIKNTIIENSRIRGLVSTIIHEKVFSKSNDEGTRFEDFLPQNMGRGLLSSGPHNNSRLLPNFSNLNRQNMNLNFNDFSIFELLRGDRNINHLSIREVNEEIENRNRTANDGESNQNSDGDSDDQEGEDSPGQEGQPNVPRAAIDNSNLRGVSEFNGINITAHTLVD